MQGKSDYIWMNGKLVPWEEARIHVGSHVVHYGSCLFEGIRCYATPRGPAIFRLDAHMARLYNSCKIYRMEVPWTRAELSGAVMETVAASRMKDCYIRPIVYRGYHHLGVNPLPCPVEGAILVWQWGKYLGEEALAQGVDVRVSAWARMAPNTHPAMAKAGGNYLNAQLILMEALVDGYVEAIALDTFGYVSEGSGENVFLVLNGALVTPPYHSMILPGITRDSVLTLARELSLPVREEVIAREALYLADEVFLVGTAAEITPVRSVDKIPVGNGRRGPVTERLQSAFFGILKGEREDKQGWLTPVAAD